MLWMEHTIKVDQHLVPPKEKPPQEETIDVASMTVSSDEFMDDDDPVFYEENDKVALILDDQHKDVWTKALEEIDFKIEYAKSPEHAAYKMKFTQFHLVGLHEAFGSVPLGKNVAYKSLCEMPMSSRRKIFLALVGEKFKTANN